MVLLMTGLVQLSILVEEEGISVVEGVRNYAHQFEIRILHL